MITELYIEQDNLALQKEFNYFCNAKPVLSNICLKNNIIKYQLSYIINDRSNFYIFISIIQYSK